MTDALPEVLNRVVGGVLAGQSQMVAEAIEAAKAVTKEEVRSMQENLKAMLKETEREIIGAVEKAEVCSFVHYSRIHSCAQLPFPTGYFDIYVSSLNCFSRWHHFRVNRRCSLIPIDILIKGRITTGVQSKLDAQTEKIGALIGEKNQEAIKELKESLLGSVLAKVKAVVREDGSKTREQLSQMEVQIAKLTEMIGNLSQAPAPPTPAPTPPTPPAPPAPPVPQGPPTVEVQFESFAVDGIPDRTQKDTLVAKFTTRVGEAAEYLLCDGVIPDDGTPLQPEEGCGHAPNFRMENVNELWLEERFSKHKCRAVPLNGPNKRSVKGMHLHIIAQDADGNPLGRPTRIVIPLKK